MTGEKRRKIIKNGKTWKQQWVATACKSLYTGFGRNNGLILGGCCCNTGGDISVTGHCRCSINHKFQYGGQKNMSLIFKSQKTSTNFWQVFSNSTYCKDRTLSYCFKWLKTKRRDKVWLWQCTVQKNWSFFLLTFADSWKWTTYRSGFSNVPKICDFHHRQNTFVILFL